MPDEAATETNDVERKPRKPVGFPKRYVLILMVFLGLAMQYALRVNINVAITAMCNNHTVKENGFTITKPAEFNWSSKLQGTVLGSFFYGYIVLQIPGGYLALRYGGTRVFGWAMLFGSLLTLLTPLAARLSVWALVALRILEGVFLGVLFPCNHDILRKWAPLSEKTRLFAITVAGCPVGTIITMPLSGLLTKYGPDGWASVFYCFGLLGLCWSFIWMLMIHPSPDEHPTISEEEKAYIKKGTAITNPKSGPVPWGSIITSIPVWAVIVANFTADWGLYTILICIPKYFVEVLKFDIAKTGFVASLPYLIKAFVGPTGGLIVDMMIKNGMSVQNARRLIFSIGCTVAAIFILAVGYSPDPVMGIAFLCIGVGITGVNATGYAVNLLDIAPKFAGVIMGITNVFGSLPGFLSPQIVGIITVNKTAGEWRTVFWITFLVYMAGVIIFSLCVSGDKQEWAMSPEELEKHKQDKEDDGGSKEKQEDKVSEDHKDEEGSPRDTEGHPDGEQEKTSHEENKDGDNEGASEDNKEPKEDNKEPSEGNKEPSEDNKEPSEENKEPSEENKEQVVGDEEPGEDKKEEEKEGDKEQGEQEGDKEGEDTESGDKKGEDTTDQKPDNTAPDAGED